MAAPCIVKFLLETIWVKSLALFLNQKLGQFWIGLGLKSCNSLDKNSEKDF